MTKNELVKKYKLNKTGKNAYFKDGLSYKTRAIYIDNFNTLYVFYRHCLYTVRALKDACNNDNTLSCKLCVAYSQYK